jgi:hypothetical protein
MKWRDVYVLWFKMDCGWLSWPILRYFPLHSSGVSEENHKRLGRDSIKREVVQVLWLSTTPWRRIGGTEVKLQTSASDGDEWSASRPGRFTPRERAPGTDWIGGWVDPEPVWTRWWRENSQPLPGLEPPIIQPIAQSYTTELSRLLVGIAFSSEFETSHFIILPIVLYGSETSSHILKEEHWACLRTGHGGEYLGPKGRK